MMLRYAVQGLGALMLVALFAALPARAEIQLLMIDQPGCIYCKQWDAEVGDAYHLTPEGKAAPLVRSRLNATLPEGMTLDRPPVFTPTFILLRDGHEIGRIEGYPGEDFFWGLLTRLLETASPGAAAVPAVVPDPAIRAPGVTEG